MSTGAILTTTSDITGSARAFVFKSWIGSYKNHSEIPFEFYARLQQQFIERILTASEVTLAVNPEHPDQIFAFVVHTGPTVHYIYTKADYRNNGLATELLERINTENTSGTFNYTTFTRMGNEFLKTRGGRLNRKLVRGPL